MSAASRVSAMRWSTRLRTLALRTWTCRIRPTGCGSSARRSAFTRGNAQARTGGMKVELDRAFPLPVPAGVAWEFLQNIEAVAGCMPGAKITERLPSGGYKGTVSVRAGPVTMSFRGEVEVHDIEPAAQSLRLVGRGADSTGTSGASLDLTARIEAVGEGASSLVGKSEVAMSGKA